MGIFNLIKNIGKPYPNNKENTNIDSTEYDDSIEFSYGPLPEFDDTEQYSSSEEDVYGPLDLDESESN